MNVFIFPTLVAIFLVIPSFALPIPRAAGQLVPRFNSGPDPQDGDIFVQPRLPPQSLDSALVPRSPSTPRSIVPPSFPGVASIRPVFPSFNFDPKSSYVLDTIEGHSHRAHLAQLAQWRAVANTYRANQASAYHDATDSTPIARSNHDIVIDAFKGRGEDEDLWKYLVLPYTTFTQAQHEFIFADLEHGYPYHMIALGRRFSAALHAQDFAHFHHSTGHTVTLHRSFLTGMRENLVKAGAEPEVYENLYNIPLTPSDITRLTEYIETYDLEGMKQVFTHAHRNRPKS